MTTVLVIATMDTKGEEIAFVAQCLRDAGVEAVTVDVSCQGPPQSKPDVSREQIAACHPRGADDVLALTDRGASISAMSEALEIFCLREHAESRLQGVLGIGGSGGTSLIARAMRALPIGLPKVLVSTVASGNTEPYVGCSDILLMPSVVDIAGLNRVSRPLLANAAHALAGMVRQKADFATETRTTLGMTMFGVTTPCVTQARQSLERSGNECLVFHATGTGGRAMEKLAGDGFLQGMLDITTTEVADEIVGGIFPAGPHRFDVLAERSLPCVLSVGALDMVNFGARETVPEQFRDRLLHVHNPQVTLMRTSPEENRACGRWMAEKLRRARTPLSVVLPEGGVSAIDAPGQPFHDPAANQVLFDTLETELAGAGHCRVTRHPAHINAPAFAETLVNEFQRMMTA